MWNRSGLTGRNNQKQLTVADLRPWLSSRGYDISSKPKKDYLVAQVEGHFKRQGM